MKKTILSLIIFCLLQSTALASVDDLVYLSPKETEALRLANEWSEEPVKPVHLGNGKVVYVLGATLPTVIASPWQISDIELAPGEVIYDILVGDSQRWLVETGTSGSASGDIPHVFVKPVYEGLKTMLVVTTNSRIYHIKLVSQANKHTHYVGFLYPEQGYALQRQKQQQQAIQQTEVNGMYVDMSTLNFRYNVEGKPKWRPVQVFDNGRQIFLKMPENLSGDLPALLVKEGSKEMLVNYRYRNDTYIVDGIYDEILLVSGVGRQQQKVVIKKEHLN